MVHCPIFDLFFRCTILPILIIIFWSGLSIFVFIVLFFIYFLFFQMVCYTTPNFYSVYIALHILAFNSKEVT